MKRQLIVLTLAGSLFGGVVPAKAGEPVWYAGGNPTNAYYPETQPAKRDYPVLKKLLIGGALVGVGFAAAKLTSPRPEPYYGGGYGSYPRHPQHRGHGHARHHNHHNHHNHGHR